MDNKELEQDLIFIEVKTRTNFEFGTPAEAVDRTKRQHILKAAKYFLYSNKIKGKNIRFDIIEVFLKNNKYKINHIKQIL